MGARRVKRSSHRPLMQRCVAGSGLKRCSLGACEREGVTDA